VTVVVIEGWENIVSLKCGEGLTGWGFFIRELREFSRMGEGIEEFGHRWHRFHRGVQGIQTQELVLHCVNKTFIKDSVSRQAYDTDTKTG
jgi:hypothetical protein